MTVKSNLKRFLKWELFLFIFLVGELIFFGLLTPSFLNVQNLLFSINDFAYIGLAAIPMTFVIITGGIDVSVGSIMGLSSITVGVLWAGGLNIWVALIIALIVCALAGLLNGLIVAYTDVQPLVVTLGTMFLFAGIALVISGGSSATGYEGISGFPNSFVQIANGITLGLPNSIWLILFFLLIFGVLLHLTKYGRNVYLVGINMKAAKYSGIATKWIVMSTYMLAGLGGGISGIILTSYFSSARSDLGAQAILPVITAVVLGGTSILGGRGTVLGTVIASIVVGMMNYGLQLSGMTSEQTTIIVGGMLIVAVVMRRFNINYVKKWFVANGSTTTKGS
ncbi:autoinducer 2 import system permease LsrD [Psychrobacillus soli]|uniref:Autoinducer 2 import system permease protein LsrD n=1 Tax=Psychrobacillus soli TaxID=1543965 RepID=A0A544TJ42_9BACI|nr:autoinducer 2 import system permease LsrD [Psychrobacillus soli]